MDYQVALAPDLDLTPAGFVAAWNETPECRAVAEARIEAAAGAQYDPLTLAAVVAVLGSVAINVASNVIYDLIKDAITKRRHPEDVSISAVDLPDGTRLIIVTPARD